MTLAIQPTVSPTDAFADRVLGDAAGFTTTVLGYIGDRLGLFKVLAGRGPATSGELASRARIHERYAREWLSAMTSAGYLDFDSRTGRFALPPEHFAVLAEEGSLAFAGGVQQMLMGMVPQTERLLGAFRRGGGVPQALYDQNLWDGMERVSGAWFDKLLVPVWLPAMPAIQRRLEHGCTFADVGCGHGRALVALARTFPQSQFVGYDGYKPAVARALENCKVAGVEDRVRIECLDASLWIPGAFDVIAAFDVLQDVPKPLAVLNAIRRALRSDGVFLCLVPNAQEDLESNAGPRETLLYGVSMLYSTTVSLAGDGEGIGACGMTELKLRELLASAGFRQVRKVPIMDDLHHLFEARL